MRDNGDCDNAIKMFHKSSEYKHDKILNAYGMWGSCLERLGKYNEAIDMYNVVVKMGPNSHEAVRAKNSIEKIKNTIKN